VPLLVASVIERVNRPTTIYGTCVLALSKI